MKNTWLTLLGIWVCTATLAQQTALGGIVTVQNSKYETGRLEPVANAQVEEDYGRSQATTTGLDGAFRLPLVGIPEQESFRFSVRKSGLEVVNTDQLKAVAGQKDAVWIYMARPEYIADFRKKIYNVGKTESEKAIERKLSQLEKDRAELQKNAAANADRIEALSAEIELAEARAKKIEQDARELAQKYERINLDDASEQYQQAFRLFQAGELDQALALLQNSPEQARKILEERERIAELYREAAARDSVQRQRSRETMQALRLKADLHRTRYEWDSVALAYEYLIRLDSTNAQNVYDYAVFLEDINRYDQALHWLATFIRMPGAEAWQVANAYGLVGQIHEETGNFSGAMAAYVEFQRQYASLTTKEAQNDFYKENFAISYERLGSLYQSQGKFDTALVYFVKYNQLGEDLYRANPKSADLLFGLGVSYYKLAALYEAMGQIPKAIAYLVKALPVFERLYEITGLDKYKQISQALAREIHRLKN